MYLYAVVKSNPELVREFAWRIPARPEREDPGAGHAGVGPQEQTQGVNGFDEVIRLTPERIVYWVYSDKEAVLLAKDLAKRFPGNEYLVMECKTAWSAVVADVVGRKHDIGKGMLPL